MPADAPLFSTLEAIVQRGSQGRRAEMLSRLTSLFVDGAATFTDEHIKLFDEVFERLITEIETKARFELSVRLAGIANAPRQIVKRLANDDEIAVAGPVLQYSERLEEPDLLDVAKSKSQQHLLAISSRRLVADTVTDVLVRRGDREVVRNVVSNSGAQLSNSGFSAVVRKAEKDGILAEKIGQRPDIPEPLLRVLFLQATRVVQKRLFAAAAPDARERIARVLEDISNEFAITPNNVVANSTASATLANGADPDETAVYRLAIEGRYDETIAALSVLCKIPIENMHRIMGNKRADPAVVVSKALGFGWGTARAMILLMTRGRGTSTQTLASKFRIFEKLSASGARDVMRLWCTLHDNAKV